MATSVDVTDFLSSARVTRSGPIGQRTGITGILLTANGDETTQTFGAASSESDLVDSLINSGVRESCEFTCVSGLQFIAIRCAVRPNATR